MSCWIQDLANSFAYLLTSKTLCDTMGELNDSPAPREYDNRGKKYGLIPEIEEWTRN